MSFNTRIQVPVSCWRRLQRHRVECRGERVLVEGEATVMVVPASRERYTRPTRRQGQSSQGRCRSGKLVLRRLVGCLRPSIEGLGTRLLGYRTPGEAWRPSIIGLKGAERGLEARRHRTGPHRCTSPRGAASLCAWPCSVGRSAAMLRGATALLCRAASTVSTATTAAP